MPAACAPDEAVDAQGRLEHPGVVPTAVTDHRGAQVLHYPQESAEARQGRSVFPASVARRVRASAPVWA